jgi:hypothetical protein
LGIGAAELAMTAEYACTQKRSAQARAIYEHAQGLTQLFQNCSISNNEIIISIIEKCRDPQITHF